MGEPEQRVHYHTEAVTEVVPVSLDAYRTSRRTRQSPDHFDTPLVDHSHGNRHGPMHGAHGSITTET